MTIDLNTILSFFVIIISSMIGFYIKQLGSRLDKMMSKEMCTVFHEAHNKEHVRIDKDLVNIGNIARGQAK